MAKKSYDESKVVRLLNKNAGVKVNTAEMVVEVLIGADTVGNGSWGKIDFLVNHRGYFVRRVKSLGKKYFTSRDEDFATTDVDTKVKKVITLSDKSKVKKVKHLA